MKISFVNEKKVKASPPIPARDSLPDWYKSAESYINNVKHHSMVNGSYVTTATIKKCMPVFDVMTSGYLISAWDDIHISVEDSGITYSIESEILAEHNTKQGQGHPSIHPADDLVAKFINPWGIHTPEGYSCLFIPPAHRENIISIMPAIVDTDSYHLAVHFPFTLTRRDFSGVISKGTPLVQVIPFKRDEWEMECSDFSQEHHEEQFNTLHGVPFNGYKDNFWASKKYT
jgi:hypothetical protein